MNSSKKLNKAIKLLAAICLFAVTVSIPVAANAGLKVPSNRKIVSKKTYKLSSGVTQYNVVTTAKNGTQREEEFYLEIDLNNSSVGMMASYGSMSTSKLTKSNASLNILTKQVKTVESKTKEDVIAAVNGDVFDWNTKLPHGPLVINGKKVYGGDSSSWWLFCIMKDGSAQFRQKTQSFKNIQYAVGANCLFLENGKINSKTNNDTKLQPRSAIGVTKSGKVIIIAADGRSNKSAGRTFYDMASELKAMGCVYGSNLDGGGSTMMATQYSGSKTMKIRNVPSDGKERTIASTLMVYAKKTVNLSKSKVTVKDANYTGKKLTPSVTVKYSGKTLKAGRDYKVEFSNNTIIGKGKVTISAVKNSGYVGSKKATFQIKYKKAVKLSATLKSTTETVPAENTTTQETTQEAATKTINTLSWKALTGTDEYYVYRSTSKGGSYKKIATTSKKTYADTVTDEKTYFYKVKAYDKSCKKTIGESDVLSSKK